MFSHIAPVKSLVFKKIRFSFQDDAETQCCESVALRFRFLNVRAKFSSVGPVMLVDARTACFAGLAFQVEARRRRHRSVRRAFVFVFFFTFSCGSLTLNAPKHAV